MEYKDYYRILGVGKKATQKDIRKAYRRLARKHHPDVNPNDKAAEARFKEINEAHEVLSDPEKRQKYEALGSSWQQWQHSGGDPRGFNWSQWSAGGQPTGRRVRVEYGDLNDLFSGGGGFSDFFRTIFGGRGGGGVYTQGPRGRRGQDLEHPVEITLEESYSGTKRVLQMGGSRLEIKIPRGVDTGSRVRVSGKGTPGIAGAPSGDLYLRVSMLPHRTWQRKGDDLYCQVAVDLYTALLGGEVAVPTPKGQVMLRIPPETHGGKRFRLKSLGMPSLKNPKLRGDLYADVKIALPQDLSKREKELFTQLASLRS